jgi:hypothetical protein
MPALALEVVEASLDAGATCIAVDLGLDAEERMLRGDLESVAGLHQPSLARPRLRLP